MNIRFSILPFPGIRSTSMVSMCFMPAKSGLIFEPNSCPLALFLPRIALSIAVRSSHAGPPQDTQYQIINSRDEKIKNSFRVTGAAKNSFSDGVPYSSLEASLLMEVDRQLLLTYLISGFCRRGSWYAKALAVEEPPGKRAFILLFG